MHSLDSRKMVLDRYQTSCGQMWAKACLLSFKLHFETFALVLQSLHFLFRSPVCYPLELAFSKSTTMNFLLGYFPLPHLTLPLGPSMFLPNTNPRFVQGNTLDQVSNHGQLNWDLADVEKRVRHMGWLSGKQTRQARPIQPLTTTRRNLWSSPSRLSLALRCQTNLWCALGQGREPAPLPATSNCLLLLN